MFILFSRGGTPTWVLDLRSRISEKHGVAFGALGPLTSTLQVETPNSPTDARAARLIAGVERGL